MVFVSRACFLLFIITFCSFISSHAVVICEDLPNYICSFSISASGKRCLLETETRQTGGIDYRCRSSEVTVDGMLANYIETDECVYVCGVDRGTVGISSDALLEPGFTVKLCSPECLEDCPNIADLYSNLVAAEGSFLPDLCGERQNNSHRSMFEILSSGAALGSFSIDMFSQAPTVAPASSPIYLSDTPMDTPALSPIYLSDAPADAPASSPIYLSDAPMDAPASSPIYLSDAPMDAPASSPIYLSDAPMDASASSPIAFSEAPMDVPASSPIYLSDAPTDAPVLAPLPYDT